MLTLSIQNIWAQSGFQISLNGTGGIGYVAPQNHYGNSHYHLKFKTKFNYGANLYAGYNFNDMVALLVNVSYLETKAAYKGDFRPGLGAPPQSHSKDISLKYLSFGPLVKISNSFQDSYVYGTGVKFFLITGLEISKLLDANLNYLANDEKVAYPTKLIPYTDLNYLYTAVSDSKDLFKDWGLFFVLSAGMDVFISDQFAFSPALYGKLSVLDINHKNFSKHEGYKVSRNYFGGLSLGFTYYINR